MKVLGGTCQSIIRGGALAIVLLHHTSKNTETVTLESGTRFGRLRRLFDVLLGDDPR